jgi:hypothetical protein
MDQPKPEAILTTISYRSINQSDISIAFCIITFTMLVCCVVAVYTDKHVNKIQDLKNARILQLENERRSLAAFSKK